MAAPGAAGPATAVAGSPGVIRSPAGNVVRVRPPVGALPGGHIKVLGASGQPQIIKTVAATSAAASAGGAGNMTGIAALAAAAAATSKISTAAVSAGQTITTASGQAIKVVQQSAAGGIVSGLKMAPGGQQTAVIGGQTVRLATSPSAASASGGTLLKSGTTLATAGGKQIILQKQGIGGGSQPQIVTLVKTSQGMQVATVPKSSIVQGATAAAGGAKQATPGVLTAGGKTIPQGATIVKLVNAPGGAGQTAKIVTNVKGLAGTNVMTSVAKGVTAAGGLQMATAASGGQPGKQQTIVLNKPGGQQTIKGAQGQQIIVVTTAGGTGTATTVKTVSTLSSVTSSGLPAGVTSAGGGVKMIVVSSGQLAQTSNKPITLAMAGGGSGGVKTVTLAGKPGMVASTAGTTQLLNTSTGQILALPAQSIAAAGGTQVRTKVLALACICAE